MVFLGLSFGNKNCKLQHISLNDNGLTVRKNSDIVLWVVYRQGEKIFYVPISKYDIENSNMVSAVQLTMAFNDRNRSIMKKTDKGDSLIPYGAIVEDN